MDEAKVGKQMPSPQRAEADRRYYLTRRRLLADYRFRKSWAWRAYIRPQHLALEPTCRSCGAPATCVDHIVPARGDPDLQRDASNLQSLCCVCHGIKTRAQAKAARTHCRRGHPLVAANIVIEGDGRRRCKTCRTLKSKRRNERRRKQKQGGNPGGVQTHFAT